jgi:hypothetical protein
MRVGLVLGVVGGILALFFSIAGYFVFFLGYSLATYLSGKESPEPSMYAGLFWSGIFSSFFSILGAVLTLRWRKIGAAISMVGVLLMLNTLVNGFMFYFLNVVPFLLVFSGAVYEFLRKAPSEQTQRIGGTGTVLQPIIISSQMICKNCGAENPLKTKICRACGVPLYEGLPGRRCPACNAPLKLASILGPGHIMCNVCYSEFQLMTVSRAYQPTPEEHRFSKKTKFGRKTKIAIAGVAVFLLFLIIAGFSASTQRQSSQGLTTNTQTTQQPIPTTITTTPARRGSLANPAFVGESVTVKAYGSTFEITVLDFTRGEEASEEIKNANLLNPSPDEGYEYALVKVRLKYVRGDDTATIGIFNFKAFVKGSGYSPQFAIYPQDKPEFKTVTLVAGGLSEGWILFEIPKNDEILISFSYLFSDPLCFIKLEKYS